MNQYQKNFEAGKILVTATDQIGSVIERNYQSGTIVQKAIAVLSALQCDLFSSFVILEPDRGPIVSRSIILRTILENHGTILHIGHSNKRATSYLGSLVEFDQLLAKRTNMEKFSVIKNDWTSSFVVDRVSKIDKNSRFMYDLLSNFTHGNNITNLISPDQENEGYESMIEDYFVSEYIQFLFMMVHELEMSDEIREVLYVAMENASKIALEGRIVSTTE
jgi:hypothetical protein